MARPLSAPNKLPEQEKLDMLLTYDPNEGKLFWRNRTLDTFLPVGKRSPEHMMGIWDSRFAGKEAGGLHSGYVRLMIDGVHYMVHRIIWKMVYGTDPDQIDHIDGDRSNNRLSNLRDVSHQVNAKNRKLYENNKTGLSGVSYHERDEVWQVRIGVGEGEEIHIGNFKLWGEAVAARLAAQTVLDYHQNHGRRN